MAIELDEPPKVSNREKILAAIKDLNDSGKSASRFAICRATGLKMSLVDDHVKKLKANGDIELVVNGVFQPVDKVQDRAVSATLVPGGGCVVEIGDTVLRLTLREGRHLGLLLGGFGMQFGR
jgi:hypothetical protein